MRVTFALFIASALLCHAEQGVDGRWEGTIDIPENTVELVLDLAKAGDGAWTGSVTLPGLNIKGATLTDINVNGAEVTLAFKTALADQQTGAAKLKLHRGADGKLTGEFTQAGNSAPLSLQRTGAAEIEPAPRSTAIAKELEGEWHGEYELFNYPRKVTLKLSNKASGAAAEFVIVGRKVNNLPVDVVTQSGQYLTVDSHETGLTFEGRVENDAISGMVLQGPLEIPVVLKRVR